MRNLKYYLFIQSLICGSLIFFSIFYFWFGLDAKDWIYPASCVTLLLCIWTFFSWNRLSKQFFDLYTIFIFATAAFNCGQIFLEIFGGNHKGILAGQFSSDIILETILYVLIALSAIHLGALFRFGKVSTIAVPGEPLDVPPEVFKVGIILIIVSIFPTIWVMKGMIDIVREHGYFALYTREDLIGVDNIASLISSFFMPGILFTLAGSRDKKNIIRWTQFGIGLYSVIFILLGRRGDGTEALLAYLIVYHYCIKPVSKKIIFSGAAFLLIVVFPLIATIRNIDLAKRGDIATMARAYEAIDNPAVAAISEMGGSMQAISSTIELVPKSRDYDLGASYLYAAFSVFPNFFWRIHPSVERGSPSVWLVKAVDPIIAEMGGGLGYSYIAEAYFNFGWWGGVIILFLIGYAVSSLVCWSQFSGDPLKIAAAATFFASLVGFVRADSQSIVRPLFWYSLLPYLFVKWWQNRNAKLLAPTSSLP